MISSITATGYAQYAQAASYPGSTSKSNGVGSTTGDSSSQDTVTLSNSAKELAKILAGDAGKASGDDSQESSDPVEKLKKQIEELEKKIAKIQQSNTPDETKQGAVEGLEDTLASLTQQLSQLMANAAKSTGGQGSGSALSSLSSAGTAVSLKA